MENDLLIDSVKTDATKQKEQRVLGILKSEGVDKDFDSFRVDFIENNVFGVGSNEGISFYCDENGNNIIHTGSLEEERHVKNGEVSKIVGYAIKGHKLHKILGYNSDGPVLDQAPTNEYSAKTYKIWLEISFYSDIFSKRQIKDNPIELSSQEKIKLLEKDIDIMIENGAISIDDLEILLKQEKIDKDYFDKALLDILQNHLINQCGDERLDEINEGITPEKLRTYYLKGYPITESLGKGCMEALKLKKTKGKKEDRIETATGKKLEAIK